MMKLGILMNPGTRPMRLSRERVTPLAVICLRCRDGVSEAPPAALQKLMTKFGSPQWRIAEPDCVFVCFSRVTHQDWDRSSKVFYGNAVNKIMGTLAGAGYAAGEELLYPDEAGRAAHEFPDGQVCREAYRRSYGEGFSKF